MAADTFKNIFHAFATHREWGHVLTRMIFAIGNVLHAQSHCTVPGYLEGNLLHQQTELYTRKGQLSGDLQQIKLIALRPSIMDLHSIAPYNDELLRYFAPINRVKFRTTMISRYYSWVGNQILMLANCFSWHLPIQAYILIVVNLSPCGHTTLQN